MPLLLLAHSSCKTCEKARRFLFENGVDFFFRDMEKFPIAATELDEHTKYHKEKLMGLFNWSSPRFKELKLATKLNDLTEWDLQRILVNNPELMNHPVLIYTDFIYAGFDEEFWREKLRL